MKPPEDLITLARSTAPAIFPPRGLERAATALAAQLSEHAFQPGSKGSALAALLQRSGLGLEAAQQKGLTKSIGVSNFGVKHLQELIDSPLTSVVPAARSKA